MLLAFHILVCKHYQWNCVSNDLSLLPLVCVRLHCQKRLPIRIILSCLLRQFWKHVESHLIVLKHTSNFFKCYSCSSMTSVCELSAQTEMTISTLLTERKFMAFETKLVWKLYCSCHWSYKHKVTWWLWPERMFLKELPKIDTPLGFLFGHGWFLRSFCLLFSSKVTCLTWRNKKLRRKRVRRKGKEWASLKTAETDVTIELMVWEFQCIINRIA